MCYFVVCNNKRSSLKERMGIGSVGFSYLCVCVTCTRIAKTPFAIVTRFVSRTSLFFSEKHREDEVGAAVSYGNNGVPNSDSGPVHTPLQL